MSPLYPLSDLVFPKALVLVGLLYSEDSGAANGWAQALDELEPILGRPILKGPVFPFNYTDYYEPEMGQSLVRAYVAFECLMSPAHLVCLKHETAALEVSLAVAGKRTVNIDPGYIDINKVVLASWKEGLYKVYLGSGVWADPVAHYYEKEFHCEDWTFPDIRSKEHFSFFKEARRLYKKQMRQMREGKMLKLYKPREEKS